MSYNIARKGSDGNTRLLKQYGGSDKGGDRPAYASGGAVTAGGNPALVEGLSASGPAAKPSLARSGRKMPGKGKPKGDKKDAKTNVNVLIMPKADGAPVGAPKPDAMPMPGPMAGPPPPMPAGPPMPPPGGPPMPMRKHGGRVHDEAKSAVHKHETAMHRGEPKTKLSVGGPAKPPKGFDAGAGGAKGRMEKARKYGK